MGAKGKDSKKEKMELLAVIGEVVVIPWNKWETQLVPCYILTILEVKGLRLNLCNIQSVYKEQLLIHKVE